MAWQEVYLERWYSRSRGWIDGTTRFHEICGEELAQLAPDAALLEIGSGSSNSSSDFFSGLGFLTGVDIDPAVQANAALDDAYVVTGEDLPFPDESFDACLSNWVLEHVEDPKTHLREVSRVLRPGGRYIARTPNRFHYVSVVAAATPHWFHKLVANRLRKLPEEVHEPWRTFYRVNSRRAIRRTAAASGLEVAQIRLMESEPVYGMASRMLFLVFLSYERIVNFSRRFEGLRHSMVIVLQKPRQ